MFIEDIADTTIFREILMFFLFLVLFDFLSWFIVCLISHFVLAFSDLD
jgi:hypothetical protein